MTVYDTTIEHVIDTSAATDRVDNVGVEALESGLQKPDMKADDMQPQTHDKPPKHPMKTDVEGALNDIDYQNAGKGKIKISAVLDADGLDMLEKKIAAFRMLIN